MEPVRQIVKRPNETIGIVPNGKQRITQLVRRLYSVILLFSQQQGEREEYSAVLADMLSAAHSAGSNRAQVKEVLRDIRAIGVDWNVRDGERDVWKNVGLIEEPGLIDGRGTPTIVTWKLPKIIRARLLDPRGFFTRISLEMMTRLRSGASIALYEICCQYVSNDHGKGEGGLTNRATIAEWMPRLTGSRKTVYEYKFLKRDVLHTAIEEINEITDLRVELVEHKIGRRVGELQFRVFRKEIIDSTRGLAGDDPVHAAALQAARSMAEQDVTPEAQHAAADRIDALIASNAEAEDDTAAAPPHGKATGRGRPALVGRSATVPPTRRKAAAKPIGPDLPPVPLRVVATSGRRAHSPSADARPMATDDAAPTRAAAATRQPRKGERRTGDAASATLPGFAVQPTASADADAGARAATPAPSASTGTANPDAPDAAPYLQRMEAIGAPAGTARRLYARHAQNLDYLARHLDFVENRVRSTTSAPLVNTVAFLQKALDHGYAEAARLPTPAGGTGRKAALQGSVAALPAADAAALEQRQEELLRRAEVWARFQAMPADDAKAALVDAFLEQTGATLKTFYRKNGVHNMIVKASLTDWLIRERNF